MLTQRHDPTSIFLAAKALSNIEREHGLFPRILGKGDNARRLAELVQRLRYEFQASDSDTSRRPIGTLPSTTIENLIIIDRSVDYATPLLTQLTYEGLVDEKFGIVHSHAEINASIAGASTGSGAQATRKVKLDSTDKLFDQLRGLHFSVVGGVLNKTARRLQTDYEERHGDKSVAELKEFVKKLPGYQNEQQSLKVQTNLAEEIVKESRTEQFARALEVQQNLIAGTDLPSVADLVEDLIARNCPLGLAIRMLCLASVVGGGLRAREYDGFRRAIVQAYGYEQLVTLDNLNKMQLLQLRGGLNPFAFGANQAVQNTDYATARRSLELIVNEVSEQDPQDIAYVFSGYAPLSVRLVQCILQKQHLAKLTKSSAASAVTESSSGWRGFEDALKSVRGALVDEGTQPGDGAAKARATLAGSGRKKTTLVFFLGGITFAEIAALQFIARQEAERRDIVICTTSIISGNKMVRAAQTVD